MNSPTPPSAPLHGIAHHAFQIIIFCILFMEIALGFAIYHGASYWLLVPLGMILGHFMHGAAVGLHEATHGLLRKNRRFNEFDGVLLGIFSFMSFSLYRAAHQTHHAYFTTERDEELWPFVLTDSPRWVRVLAAGLELTLGLVFTPLLFLRAFLRQGSPIRSAKVRRRIWLELGLMVIVWAAILTVISQLALWPYFGFMYLLPAFIAGNLQTWRKYVEHVGLTGGTANSGTRNIVTDTPSGRLLAFTLLHEPFHGVHHLHVGLPHAELPGRVKELTPVAQEDLPLFPSYRHAVWHLLRQLGDPKVGAQWRRAS